MKRTLIRIVLATAFVGAGWSLGRAQTQVAEFEIAVDSPRGDVKLTCSRGCDWSREVCPRDSSLRSRSSVKPIGASAC